MRKSALLAGREIRSLFLSPVAYIVIGLFLVVTGWFFFSSFFVYDVADLRRFFDLLPLVLSFVVPAITMRLFAEELRSGSYEVLSTLPLGIGWIVAGKFIAAFVLVTVMIAPTISYAIFVSRMGDMDWGPVIGGYLGAPALAASFCAIGLFASSVTRNQIVAYVIGVAICVFLSTIERFLIFVPGTVANLLQYLGADYHFSNIAKGVLDTRDVLFFLSVTSVGLFAAARSLCLKQ